MLFRSPGGPDLDWLKARFEAGEWANRWPAEVEVPFETLIGDRVVRGRIDAVFADSAGGGYDVVDWKTGRQPSTAAEKRIVAVQLAAYRLAWAALAGVPLSEVSAAFYYVRDNVTVRPADLLDAAGLAVLIENVASAESLATADEDRPRRPVGPNRGRDLGHRPRQITSGASRHE